MKHRIDVTGQTCPIPLIEMRKAIRRAQSGDIIEIIGTHESSRKEIPMAIKSLGLSIIDNTLNNNVWTITVEV